MIPGEVELTGTIRTYQMDTHIKVAERFEAIAEQIAGALGCQTTLEINALTLPVVNDKAVAARLREGFPTVENVTLRNDERTMGAEDIAFFLQEAPGVFFLVGSANKDRGLDYPHHHPQFDIDEESLVIGANLLASAVGEYVLPNR